MEQYRVTSFLNPNLVIINIELSFDNLDNESEVMRIMYTFEELSQKLGISVKTVRRYVKSEGIKYVDKDGGAWLFDDKALAVLRDHLATKHHKYQAVEEAGKVNAKNAKSAKVQDLLLRLDQTGRTLASDQYLISVAEHVADMLKNDADINKVIGKLDKAINRAQLIDDRYDDLTTQISQLSDKVDHLYDKLVHNIKSFDYRKMAKVNAEAFMDLAKSQRQTGSKGHGPLSTATHGQRRP